VEECKELTIQAIGGDWDMSNAMFLGVENTAEVGMKEGGISGRSNAADGDNGNSHVRRIENILE